LNIAASLLRPLLVRAAAAQGKDMLDRILLTNDDGIDAPGLAVAEAIAGELAREVWVVAPEHGATASPARRATAPCSASPS
jgi:hypothetical protein